MSISFGARPTVVLADDHPGMLAEVLTFLEPYCQIVAAVENGILAVEAISEWRPDIAILDVVMPGMTGFEVAQRLREVKSATRIVLLTVQYGPDYIETADGLGAGLVTKSLMRSDLLPAIEKELGHPLTKKPIAL